MSVSLESISTRRPSSIAAHSNPSKPDAYSNRFTRIALRRPLLTADQVSPSQAFSNHNIIDILHRLSCVLCDRVPLDLGCCSCYLYKSFHSALNMMRRRAHYQSSKEFKNQSGQGPRLALMRGDHFEQHCSES